MKEAYKRIAWTAKLENCQVISLRFGMPMQTTDGKCEVRYPFFPRIRHLINTINDKSP